MFMGDGFEGIQFMDILIFGLIAFLLFRFLAARRRQQQPAMAGHAPMQREMPQQPATSIFGGSAAPVAAAPVINAPAWFNEQNFVAAAREHFLSLQQHWDANEMDKIAEFVTRSCWVSSSRSAPRSVMPISRPTSTICRSSSTASTTTPRRPPQR